MIVCDRCRCNQGFPRFIPKHILPEDFINAYRMDVIVQVDLCNSCIKEFNSRIDDFVVSMKEKFK